MKWYVVQAYSQYEMRVKQLLTERIARAGLEDLRAQVFPRLCVGRNGNE